MSTTEPERGQDKPVAQHQLTSFQSVTPKCNVSKHQHTKPAFPNCAPDFLCTDYVDKQEMYFALIS